MDTPTGRPLEGIVAPPWQLSCSTFTPPYTDRDDVVAPGAPIPRVRVTPMSFSPDTGFIYAQGRGQIGRARRVTKDPWFRGGARSYTQLPGPVGIVAAIDVRTNRIAWKHEVAPSTLGTSGPLTTAGGLMFRGSGVCRPLADGATGGVWYRGRPRDRLRTHDTDSWRCDGESVARWTI